MPENAGRENSLTASVAIFDDLAAINAAARVNSAPLISRFDHGHRGQGKLVAARNPPELKKIILLFSIC